MPDYLRLSKQPGEANPKMIQYLAIVSHDDEHEIIIIGIHYHAGGAKKLCEQYAIENGETSLKVNI